MAEKKIEVVEMRAAELQDNIGNPRTITQKKANELKESLERLGDFGIIVIDDKNNIISGHQRVKALLATQGEDAVVLCKRLVGYTEAELRAINIKANTHSGDWDLKKLSEWTADLNIHLGLDLPKIEAENHEIKQMELIRFEKYDYVMVVCRNEMDYNNLLRMLELDGKEIAISKTQKGQRKIKARAIWYDELCKKVTIKSKTKK